MSPKMRLIDVNGLPHELTEYQVRMMITIGWLTFVAAWVMNICFYKSHPSAVDFSPERFRDKMFIFILGKKYNLIYSFSSCSGCTSCSDCCCSSCCTTCSYCSKTCSDRCCTKCSNCCKGKFERKNCIVLKHLNQFLIFQMIRVTLITIRRRTLV